MVNEQTPCFFRFGASSHPYINYIPFLLKKRFSHLFQLFLSAYDSTTFSVTLMFMGSYVVTDISRSYYVLLVPEAVYA